MSTASRPRTRPKIGPQHHGKAMSFRRFIAHDFEDGHIYELARGIVVMTDIPGLPHGQIVRRIAKLFWRYDEAHPGFFTYQAGGSDCRLRLPAMSCDRHPDQAVYLTEPPPGDRPWTRWVPDLVVEVVSPDGVDRDYVEKREEYLAAGVREYWIVDPRLRRILVLFRVDDAWEEHEIAARDSIASRVLPGLLVQPLELFGDTPTGGPKRKRG
jgi:Uma2 family endonuclease